MKVTSKGLQEIYGRGETAKAIFVSEAAKHAEHTNRLVSLGCGLGYTFWNCLEDAFEPIRFNASKNLAPEEEIPDGSNGFRSFCAVHYLLENFVARG
jgi:hypothetical protein